MRHALALVTPPAAEPVSLDEAKQWARIDAADDDDLIAALVTAARQAAEEYLRRSLVTQTWRATLDGGYRSGGWTPGVYDLPVNSFDGVLPDALDLPRGPVLAVTSVTTYGTDDAAAVFDPAGYRLSGDRLILNAGFRWPGPLRPVGGTEVVYTAGYGDATAVPRPIRQGILVHVATLYEQRGQCDAAADLPPGARLLYDKYRLLAPVAKCSYLPATFRKRVTVQTPVRQPDGQGGFAELWATVATVHCSVETVKADERFQAMQQAPVATHVVVMRYHPLVDAACRLVFEGRVFAVKGVVDQNQERRFLTVKAVEVGALDLDSFAYLMLEGGGSLLLQSGGRLLLGGGPADLLAFALDFSNPDNSAYLGAI